MKIINVHKWSDENDPAGEISSLFFVHPFASLWQALYNKIE